MKTKYLFILLLIISKASAQIGFNVEYEADYKLVYKNQTKNSSIQEAAFALLINKKESYFKNMNKYIQDSLSFEKKINENTSINDLLKYQTEFPENIGTTSAKLYVTTSISSKNYKYEETNNITWQLLNEFKKIDKYNCQKATTKKYGRTWYAYFTEDIPFQFGPYKFNNLPGLILEVYDEKQDYVFSIYSFRKRKYFAKSANMQSNAVLVNKSKIFDYQRKEIGDPNNYNKIITDPESLRFVLKKSQERAKNYNPLELEIL